MKLKNSILEEITSKNIDHCAQLLGSSLNKKNVEMSITIGAPTNQHKYKGCTLSTDMVNGVDIKVNHQGHIPGPILDSKNAMPVISISGELSYRNPKGKNHTFCIYLPIGTMIEFMDFGDIIITTSDANETENPLPVIQPSRILPGFKMKVDYPCVYGVTYIRLNITETTDDVDGSMYYDGIESAMPILSDLITELQSTFTQTILSSKCSMDKINVAPDIILDVSNIRERVSKDVASLMISTMSKPDSNRHLNLSTAVYNILYIANKLVAPANIISTTSTPDTVLILKDELKSRLREAYSSLELIRKTLADKLTDSHCLYMRNNKVISQISNAEFVLRGMLHTLSEIENNVHIDG